RRAGSTVLARIWLIPRSPSSPAAARVPLQPPLPAGIVPVTAVLRAAGVGRPGDQMGGARRGLLVAARAAVGLRAGGAGPRPDRPVPVGRRFGALGAEPERGAVRPLIPARVPRAAARDATTRLAGHARRQPAGLARAHGRHCRPSRRTSPPRRPAGARGGAAPRRPAARPAVRW